MKEEYGKEEYYVLGIDVGGSFTKMMVFTDQGEQIGAHAFESPRVFDESTHQLLASRIVPLFTQAKIDRQRVRAIGLALPGAVTAENSLEFCPNLDLDITSYQAFLCAQFPQARVVVMNDADAAVLGDAWRGSASHLKSKQVLFVALGTGVGAGLLLDGKLCSGAHGAAGEVGHIRVNATEERLCNCGKTGCLEQYASATALVRMAREAHPDQVHAAQAYPDARAVLESAQQNDPVATAAVDRFADALGFGLAQIACIFDPELIVLGGGISESAQVFLASVCASYRAHAISVCRETPIVASSLGNQCGTYGAGYRALEIIE